MEFVYVNSEKDRDTLLELGVPLAGQKQGANFWAFRIGHLTYTQADEILGQLDLYVLSNTLMF